MPREQITHYELLGALRHEGCTSLMRVRHAALENDVPISVGLLAQRQRAVTSVLSLDRGQLRALLASKRLRRPSRTQSALRGLFPPPENMAGDHGHDRAVQSYRLPRIGGGFVVLLLSAE
jgi:hypothetical protein